MFGRHRKALADNRVAELKMDNERLERSIMGLRRQRDRALCPISGLRQQGYAEGLAEGIQRGRVQARQAQHQNYGTDPLRQHEHNFSELEARVAADMLARPELYGNVKEEMIARGYGMSFGRWSARSPQLQNIPRPAPALVNISFEYNGKRSTFPLGNSTIKLELEERDGGNVTRVICHKPDNSIVHYDYRTASITSEIRKEYK